VAFHATGLGLSSFVTSYLPFHVGHCTAHRRRKRVMITAYWVVAAVNHFAACAIILNRGDTLYVPLAAVAHYGNPRFFHCCTVPLLCAPSGGLTAGLCLTNAQLV
jgi:hypothetical protein